MRSREEEIGERDLVGGEGHDRRGVAEDRIGLREGARDEVCEEIAAWARLGDDGVAEAERDVERAERGGEDVAGEDDGVDAARPHRRASGAGQARVVDDRRERVGGDALERGLDAPAHVGDAEPARAGERLLLRRGELAERLRGAEEELDAPLFAERLESRGDRARPLEPVFERIDEAEAHALPPSISSMASEQPRGVAPGARPRSSISPSNLRARSEVWMQAMESRLARSSMRRRPSSPSGSGSRVSGLTTSARTHAGGT